MLTMYRFVDLNDSYWTNPDGSEGALCAILDTRTNRFLECDGQHVLSDIGMVRDAAGERGVGLVPKGFFERPRHLRAHIENVLGLEPMFAVGDDGAAACGPWAEKDAEKRYSVTDAEMETVCRCEKREYADLICELLNRA